METVRKFFMERDKLAQHLGIELEEVREGYARASLKLEEYHMNGVRVAHGATVFALADLALAAASNSHGTVALAVSASISYTKAGVSGVLTAECRELSRGNRLATYEALIRDEAGEVIAAFQGTVYRKKDYLKDII